MTIFGKIRKECQRQDELWGEQDHPISDDLKNDFELASALKAINKSTMTTITWKNIILEEVYEATSETDLAKARVEWIQVAAVAVQIIKNLNRKISLQKEIEITKDDRKLYREIGRRLARIRKENKLTQEMLANQLGMSRTSITNYETGRNRMSVPVLYMIADVLEKSVYEFLPAADKIRGE